MTLELDRQDLECLIRGSEPDYSVMNHKLFLKAGFVYSDQYGTLSWYKLKLLTDQELFELYLICKNSRPTKNN